MPLAARQNPTPVSQALPAELEPALRASHVEAALVLLDSHATLRARLGVFGEPKLPQLDALSPPRISIVLVTRGSLVPPALVLEAHGVAAYAALHPIPRRALTNIRDHVHLPVVATWTKALPEARALLQCAKKAMIVVEGKSAGVGQATHLLVRIDVSAVRVWACQLFPY